MFLVQWKSGDQTWIPFHQLAERDVLPEYLDALGLKSISDLKDSYHEGLDTRDEFEMEVNFIQLDFKGLRDLNYRAYTETISLAQKSPIIRRVAYAPIPADTMANAPYRYSHFSRDQYDQDLPFNGNVPHYPRGGDPREYDTYRGYNERSYSLKPNDHRRVTDFAILRGSNSDGDYFRRSATYGPAVSDYEPTFGQPPHNRDLPHRSGSNGPMWDMMGNYGSAVTVALNLVRSEKSEDNAVAAQRRINQSRESRNPPPPPNYHGHHYSRGSYSYRRGTGSRGRGGRGFGRKPYFRSLTYHRNSDTRDEGSSSSSGFSTTTSSRDRTTGNTPTTARDEAHPRHHNYREQEIRQPTTHVPREPRSSPPRRDPSVDSDVSMRTDARRQEDVDISSTTLDTSAIIPSPMHVDTPSPSVSREAPGHLSEPFSTPAVSEEERQKDVADREERWQIRRKKLAAEWKKKNEIRAGYTVGPTVAAQVATESTADNRETTGMARIDSDPITVAPGNLTTASSSNGFASEKAIRSSSPPTRPSSRASSASSLGIARMERLNVGDENTELDNEKTPKAFDREMTLPPLSEEELDADFDIDPDYSKKGKARDVSESETPVASSSK
jgi:hypothetical protein